MLRTGFLNLRSAFASIWRIRSLVTLNAFPTSSRVLCRRRNKNHHTLPVKSTCRSFSHRRSKEFCKQPTIPPGFRRKTQRMFPVMTMFPCGDLDVLLGVECWSEACRRRESRATFGEEPSGVAANLWLLRRSTPLQLAPPQEHNRPTERADAGTCGRGEKRLPLSNRHPERRADSLSGLCVLTAGNSRPDSQSSPPPSTKEKGLTPNRFRIGVLRRKLPACTTRSLMPNIPNREMLQEIWCSPSRLVSTRPTPVTATRRVEVPCGAPLRRNHRSDEGDCRRGSTTRYR